MSRYRKSTAKFSGPTKAGIYKSSREGWLKVVTPYNADFVDELKSNIQPSHRQWDPDNKHWLINDLYLEDLVNMCQRHYDEIETDLKEGDTEHENLFTQVFEILPEDSRKNVYRVLALALHPDKGGSEELMKKLNEAFSSK